MNLFYFFYSHTFFIFIFIYPFLFLLDSPPLPKQAAQQDNKTVVETPPEKVVKTAAGFSDLFSAPSDPDIAMDIPISLSSESLMSVGAVTSGEATPAPTKPPLPKALSLEYPEVRTLAFAFVFIFAVTLHILNHVKFKHLPALNVRFLLLRSY